MCNRINRIIQFRDIPVIVFGAGVWGENAVKALNDNGFNLIAITDNNKELWGGYKFGIKVISPMEAAENKSALFIIAIKSCRNEVIGQLINLGIDVENILEYSFEMDYKLYEISGSSRIELQSFVMPSIEEDYCMGCGACESICDFHALKLIPDEFGYYKPEIDESRCVGCGKCDRICPARNDLNHFNTDKPKLYSFYAAHEEILRNSSSGGIFPIIAKHIINENGVVYGVAWATDTDSDEDYIWENGLYAVHTRVSDEEKLKILFKSKYIQSYVGNSLKRVKDDLDNGRKVLFSGCPCQVAGLISFIGKEYDSLYTVDLLCGYSPSAFFFQEYIGEAFGKNIEKYTFRYKENKWDCTTVRVDLANKGELVLHGQLEDIYQQVYHDHTMCSIHCQNCKYQHLPRFGDLTIGDFWGYEKYDKENMNYMGTSAVLANNEKGERLLSALSKDEIGMIKEVPIEWLGNNGFVRSDSSNYCSKYRDRFYQAIKNNLSFSKSIKYAIYDKKDKFKGAL